MNTNTETLLWVYHVKQSVIMRHPEKVVKVTIGDENPYTFPDDYDHVAMVEGYDVEDAFQHTQNLDKPWTQNENVTVIGLDGNYRSSMVGDVVCVGSVPWVCIGSGWDKLETPATEAPAHDYGDEQCEEYYTEAQYGMDPAYDGGA